MGEAPFHLLSEVEPDEQRVKEDQPRERREFLVLESEAWDFVETGADFCFTVFHLWSPLEFAAVDVTQQA
jgi:hypothetical protein